MVTLAVEVEEDVAQALAASATAYQVSIEQIAADTLSLLTRADDRSLDRGRWSAEDLAAIDEGFAQLDRGEYYTQEEVEAHIGSLLRDG